MGEADAIKQCFKEDKKLLIDKNKEFKSQFIEALNDEDILNKLKDRLGLDKFQIGNLKIDSYSS